MDNTYEVMKKLEEKTGDSTFFSGMLGMEQIPTEALALWAPMLHWKNFWQR